MKELVGMSNDVERACNTLNISMPTVYPGVSRLVKDSRNVSMVTNSDFYNLLSKHFSIKLPALCSSFNGCSVPRLQIR